MPKKIFELAKEVDMGALDLVDKLKDLGIAVRNHMSILSDEEVGRVMQLLKDDEEREQSKIKKAVKKKAKVVKKVEEELPEPEESAEGGKSSKSVVTVKRKATIRKKVSPNEGHLEYGEVAGTSASMSGKSLSHELEGEESEEEMMEFSHQDAVAAEESKDLQEDKYSEAMKSSESINAKGLQSEMSEGNLMQAVEEGKRAPQKVDAFFEEEKLRSRGLQVVYRPKVVEPVPVANVKEELAATTKSKRLEEPFEQKMHSFTPIYIPPKKKVETEEDDKKKDKKPTTKVEGERDPEEDKLIAEGKDPKKRFGGLAAMVTKAKGAVSKIRDIDQMRADEELKSYSTEIVGKAIYTPVGRKKIYLGPSKETKITAIKDSKRNVQVHRGCQVQELAHKLSLKFEELKNKCLDINLLIKPEDYLGIKLLSKVAQLYNYRVENVAFDEASYLTKSQKREDQQVQDENLRPKNPVVAIMGHVDHGKTTLLDYIRKEKVAAKEAGGITQHVGAYTVPMDGRSITFLDTPGHAAFASMRERGAKITDIVVLVVAADDGIMPQTKESIQFCQTEGVAIIVAINKMDKEGVNPDRIKQELTAYNLTPEEWGGETQCVGISALKGTGVDKLLESISVQAEILELKADPTGGAEGVVIESKVEAGRGAVTTVLIQKGTLKKGDPIVVGESYGRTRSMLDYAGKPLNAASPATPVQIIGLNVPPAPGDFLNVVKSEKEARVLADNRTQARLERDQTPKKKMSLEDFFAASAQATDRKILKLILRTDVAGSFEAIKNALATLGNAEVEVDLAAGGTGAITDNDVQLANSIGAYIIGFNMRPITTARKLAEQYGLDIKTYSIIYDLINDVKLALEGLLDPVHVERYIGRAEVRNTFSIPNVGTIAGSAVIDGKIARGCKVRLLREGKIIFDGKLASLKRFKDDVSEVKNGYECGLSLENFNNIKVQDIVEAYLIDEKKRKLEDVEVSQAKL